PLSIQATSIDLTSLIQTFMNLQTEQDAHQKDAVYERPAVRELVSAVYNLDVAQNDLKSFKRYLEDQLADPESPLRGALSGMQYSYSISPQVYTRTAGGSIIQSDTTQMIQKLLISVMGADAASASWMTTWDQNSTYGQMYTASGMSSVMGGGMMTLWQELLPGENGAPVNPLITHQYELIYGSWPASYDQVVLVVDENNELDDMTLYALGLIPEEEMQAIADGRDTGAVRQD